MDGTSSQYLCLLGKPWKMYEGGMGLVGSGLGVLCVYEGFLFPWVDGCALSFHLSRCCSASIWCGVCGYRVSLSMWCLYLFLCLSVC